MKCIHTNTDILVLSTQSR